VRAAVDEEMEKALTIWSAVIELNFLLVPSNTSADITITFASRAHGDTMPFDGKGMVLAHAFPSPPGKVHFDDDEPWTIRKNTGEIMQQCLTHIIVRIKCLSVVQTETLKGEYSSYMFT
jgi:hypothetical protein